MPQKETETLVIRRRVFFKVARDLAEYLKDISPSEELLQTLHGMEVDVFTFLERRWCFRVPNPPEEWATAEDNVALIQTQPYQKWLQIVGKKTRNMIRKAEKSGIRAEVSAPSGKLTEGIWKIFNETPIRQERGFPHYGMSLETVGKIVFSQQNCTFIAAYLQRELAGFIQLVHGENITIISQILSLQKHRDKAVNNALVAKVMEFCATNNLRWVMYGRIGNNPSLDSFKQSNGFHRFVLARYFVPLTSKGKIAIRLGLHREIKDSLPRSVKTPLIPIYNWTSRTRMRVRLLLRRQTRVIQSP